LEFGEQMDIDTLREHVRQDRLRLTLHARREMAAARLCEAEVRESLLCGEMTATEPGQLGPKYRVQGGTFYTDRVVESVCALQFDEDADDTYLVLVTVFERKRKPSGRAK